MPKFTDTHIKGLKKKEARYEEYEGGGFGIRVATTGVKAWIYRYKILGTTYKLTLGYYPDMSLANANKRYIDLNALRKNGLNPKEVIEQQEREAQEKKAQEQKLAEGKETVAKLVLQWYSGYAEKNHKKPYKIKQQIDADIIPTLGHFALDEIETKDIVAALDKIVARGARIHANRVLSTIKQAFRYGKSRGSLKHNPASDIRSRDIGGIENARDRVLSMEEIKTIWLFLDADESHMTLQVRIAIKIMLLTGVRTSELRLATWDEFNFDESLWIVPAEHCKGAAIHKVHLSPQVKALLVELKRSIKSNYVICGFDKDTHLSENALARAISRIQARVGIAQWRAHDLRRTFATKLGETLRIDPVVIEKCLGHKMPKIMDTYNKNEMLPERRDALNQWGRYIENLVTNANVIALEHAV
ncbi:MAG: tyrosine-type recombinase/integrase [Coxiellaceae bacterium]|nr:tyrosine-type recombinase/integrase [Coxiellaceae bacterium]